MPAGNRLGNVFGLFGNIDSNIGKSVVNPVSQASGAAVGGAQATGRLGQAQSFAGAEQARVQREQTARDSALQQAQQYQQQIAQEAEAAQQRDRLDREQAFQEQEFRLQQAQFENQITLDSQRQAEEVRNNRAQAADQLSQQNGGRGVLPPHWYGGTRSGVNYAYSPSEIQQQMYNWRQISDVFTPGSGTNFLANQSSYNKRLTDNMRQLDQFNQYDQAMREAGYTRQQYADGSPRYVMAGERNF